MLSEEAADDPGRLSAERVWIIDPLDGTREFGEPGRVDWAVHVALWERGELTAGAVALPAQGTVLSTAEPPDGRKPPGSALRGVPGHGGLGATGVRAIPGQQSPGGQSPQSAECPPGSALRLVISRSRPPEFVRRLADLLGAELVPLGSAGAKAAAVITGEVDAYVHSGGQYEWDTAAPVAVARSAGLHASRIDGSGLRYNREHPWMPDILICPSSLADRMLEAISEVSTGGLGAGRSVD